MTSNRKSLSKLLPKSVHQFAEEDYWNKFFKNRKEFEWYAEYNHLKDVFNKYIKFNDSLLIIGCGNSSLSAELYDYGFKNNISVDISEVVVQQMNQKYNSKDERKGLEFKCMDVFDLKFDKNSFSVVIDKGTLDAIASDNKSLDVNKMFEQMDSVLKPFGRYLCVSLLESHILKKIIDWFSQNGNWFIRIERIESAEDMTRQQSDKSKVLPVFCIICTKLLPSKDSKTNPIIELCLEQSNGKPKRVDDIQKVFERIKSIQEFAFIQHYINNIEISKNEDIYLNFFDEINSDIPRYTLYFTNYVNKRSKTLSSCGVFIVPEGREVEWLFSTPKGRIELTKQSGFERLIVVHLNREHNYSDIERIKSELSPKILELMPKNLIIDSKIPFLTIGEDIGERNIVFKGKSDFSGDYVIEEIAINSDIYRRLIFLNNKNIIQSEAKLKTIKKGKKRVSIIESNFLSCTHHEIISSGLTLLSQNTSKQFDILLIGLGGGCLPSYLVDNIKSDVKLRIKVIEIDPSMKDISLKWFDLKTTNESKNIILDIEIEDGLKYIQRLDPKTESYDAIIFDIDSKDSKEGLSCPPKAFLEIEFIEKVKTLLSERNGVFILNLVSRNEDIKQEVYKRLRHVFESTFVYPIKQELNEICFALPSKTTIDWLNQKGLLNKLDALSKHCFYMESLKESYIDLCSNRFQRIS